MLLVHATSTPMARIRTGSQGTKPSLSVLLGISCQQELAAMEPTCHLLQMLAPVALRNPILTLRKPAAMLQGFPYPFHPDAAHGPLQPGKPGSLDRPDGA